MLISSAFVSWVCVFLYTYYTNKYYGYSTIEQFKDIMPSLGVALLMAVPIYLLTFLPISGYILLPVQIVLGFLLVVFWGRALKLEEYKFVRETVGGILRSKSAK